MEVMQLRLNTFLQALETLEKSIQLYLVYPTTPHADEQLILATRDSMIQRFEYCTDLFWKVLKLYLENIEKVTLPINSPRGIIRATAQTKLIAEKESELCLQMIDNRNETSHIYRQEVAERIAGNIPHYYNLMQSIAGRLS